MSGENETSWDYRQDLLVVRDGQYYHIPKDVWMNQEKHLVDSNKRVEHLVKNGAAAASIPTVPAGGAEETPVPGIFGATCFLLNLDVLKGGPDGG
ncbi:hypothetical protein E1180_12880 [Roseibium denhamense]|uniref:hypothetical protein n=1 Tax=Roseibium denhamense TaxID=76305 RepID=UPI0012BCF23A|nr:hypothetical protein [Roseibium denhamense]MTI06411.1 hypothetical protein [Roseibium denhamense]